MHRASQRTWHILSPPIGELFPTLCSGGFRKDIGGGGNPQCQVPVPRRCRGMKPEGTPE